MIDKTKVIKPVIYKIGIRGFFREACLMTYNGANPTFEKDAKVIKKFLWNSVPEGTIKATILLLLEECEEYLFNKEYSYQKEGIARFETVRNAFFEHFVRKAVKVV